MAYVDVDFDAALADREGTRRRLAAGEKLRLLMDGLPFTYLVKPEDIDGFVERTANPSSAQLPLPTPMRSARGAAYKVDQGFLDRLARGPTMNGLEVIESMLNPPKELCDIFGTPEMQAEIRAIVDASRGRN